MRSYPRAYKKENRLPGLWLCYTVLFLAVAYFVFRPFLWNGRSLIWDKDGLYQTYTAMVYYREYWRTVISGLLNQGVLSLPMMDMQIGLGFDVLTTLNHYGFGDILLNLSLLFEPEQMELCYGILAILRYYLSGLTFLLYCRYMGKGRLTCVAGAFCYGFCGYALYAGVRHPYFLNSMIYFPLMLMGVEQILKGKKGILLSVTVGLAASSNFYFMYMLTILTLIYALLRYLQLEQRGWRERLMPTLFRGIGWYLLGLSLAAVFLLPSVLAYLNNARSGISNQFDRSMFAYEGWFYGELLQGFIFPSFGAYYWVVLSYPPLVLFALACLFGDRKKEDGFIRKMTVILFLLLLLPVGGLFMNGFAYVSHRWIYGLSFLMSYVLVCKADRIEDMEEKHCRLVMISMAGVFLLALIPGIPTEGFAGTAALFFATLFVIYWGNKGKGRNRRLVQPALLLLVIGTILLNAKILYSPDHLDYVSQFQPRGQALSIMGSGMEHGIDGSLEDGFRITTDEDDKINQSMIGGYYGTAGFFSIVNNDVYQYMKALEVDTSKFPNWFYGFGDRTSLETLGAVRYDIKNKENPWAPAFGYSLVGEGIYENQYALPLGYVYSSVIGEDEFLKLSAIEKQQAMMQAVMMEGVKDSRGDAPVFEETTLSYEISQAKNLTWDQSQGKLHIGPGGGSLTLSFQGIPDSETYLRFCNYDINQSGYELVNVKVADESGHMKKFYQASTKSVWYGDFHHFIVNLGYSAHGAKEAVINFPFEGEFILENLELYSLPMAPYKEQAVTLQSRSMTQVNIVSNQISGKVVSETDGILCFAIPYSKGFRAYVDGKQVPVSKANIMYMAIPIEEGDHEILLKYRTPGLLAGGMIGMGAVCLLVFFIIGDRKRAKR